MAVTAAVQFSLLAAALADIRYRPADQIRGPKRLPVTPLVSIGRQ
jgi:hypothetical protein